MKNAGEGVERKLRIKRGKQERVKPLGLCGLESGARRERCEQGKVVVGSKAPAELLGHVDFLSAL
jgi:hypothetical protein